MIAFTYRLEKATAPKFPPLTGVEAAVKAALLRAVDRIQNQMVLRDVVAALEANDIRGAVEAIRVDLGEEFLQSALPVNLRRAYELTAIASAESIGYAFDIVSPAAVDWIRLNTGNLIRQWGESSREAIARIIQQGLEKHIPAATLARQIPETGIGLTWRQARAVLNMRNRMAEQGVAADKIEARAERYFRRLARDRAEMIARTEMTRASEAARRESWKQAINQGLLDPTRMEREWLATNDLRACPDCAELDGTRAAVPDGIFISDGGVDGGQGPPHHPRCRCRSLIVPKGSAKMPRAAQNFPGDPGIRRRPRP